MSRVEDVLFCHRTDTFRTYGSLLRLDVMALRTLSVRFLRLTTATSTRLWTSGWARASAGETSYGSELQQIQSGRDQTSADT